MNEISPEVAVLGGALLDGRVVTELRERLGPEHFAEPRHATVWRVLLTLDDRGAPIEVQAVHAELDRLGALSLCPLLWLAGLSDAAPSSVSAPWYADLVLEAWVRRRLAAAGERLTAMAPDPNLGVAELRSRAAEEIEGAVGTGRLTRLQIEPAEVMTVKTWQALERSRGGQGVTGIPSGFRQLDALSTGWHPGDLVVVGARPGTGKSTLLVHFAIGAATTGRRVLIVSLEQSGEALMTRMLASVGRVDEHRLRAGLANAEEFAAAASAMNELQVLPIDWLEPGTLALPELRAVVRRLRAQGHLDLLILDQLGNLTPSNARENRTQQVSELSGGLKRLAVEARIPIVAAHQLNRAAEGSDPQEAPLLKHLRDSGSCEQDADVVLLLHRGWTQAQGRSDGPLDLAVAKNRRGSLGVAKLQFSGRMTKFSEPLLAVAR